MMQSEFAERTGYYPTYEEYEIIEQAYLESEKDKDGFCKEWIMKNAAGVWDIERPIWKKLLETTLNDARQLRKRNQEINALKKEIESLKSELKKASDSWLEFAE